MFSGFPCVVYARDNDLTYNSIRFDRSLKNFKKPLDTLWPQLNTKKRSEEYLVMILEIWCLSKVRTRSAGRIGDFGNLLIAFSLKAHTYYPTYDIGAYYSDWTLAALCWIFFMKTFYNVIISILCCAKEARASIVLDWLNECNLSRKIVKNYRIIALNRAKIILPEVCMRCITSDVMCKKYILKAALYATSFVTKIYLY